MATMTVSSIGAPSARPDKWDAIDWQTIGRQVRRLQVRIAKATKQKRAGKVKALQWLLAHSYAAKAWAVRRVVRNRGRHTPGVDGVVWKTARQKMAAVRSLKRQGYRPAPLRRVHIPKRNGQRRPLSIPTMRDRAMQALHLLALDPVAEMQADRNSYGFRRGRSTADALGQCYIALAKSYSARWVLEGDIESCFDRISHSWLLDHVPMDRAILRAWLQAGYLQGAVFYATEEGTPQGGIASPVLANLALDGLEQVARGAVPPRSKVNVVRYADDFVITGNSKQMLEAKVKPAIEAFLAERGLRLSADKTHVTCIDDGFEFLGAQIKKYGDKLLITPAKRVVSRFVQEIRRVLRTHRAIKTAKLVALLNAKIRGWAYQFRHLVAHRAFQRVDFSIRDSLWRWVRRQHPEKSASWLSRRYFRRISPGRTVFSAYAPGRDGQVRRLDLFLASSLPIIRHVKVRGHATVYDPDHQAYFHRRWWIQRRRPGPKPLSCSAF